MYARRTACARENVAARAAGDTSLIFLSSTGTPIGPKNFVRAFHEISRKAGLPYIKLHHTRHTAATMLKNLGVPARDAQLILGHAHVTTTQQLYQHADIEGQSQAIARVEQQLLASAVAVTTAVNVIESTGESTNFMRLTPGGSVIDGRNGTVSATGLGHRAPGTRPLREPPGPCRRRRPARWRGRGRRDR